MFSDILKQIDNVADDYLTRVRTIPTEKRKDQLESITKLFCKSREYGDDKVQLAMQTYEMVRVLLIISPQPKWGAI